MKKKTKNERENQTRKCFLFQTTSTTWVKKEGKKKNEMWTATIKSITNFICWIFH